MSEHLLRFEIRPTPVRHVLDLGRGQRSMTMNDPYRSVASTTPLDLRTTNREGGIGSSSNSLPVTAADCDRTTASDRAPDAETSTSAGSRVAEHRAHASTTSRSETPLLRDTNSNRRHGGPVERRTLDKTPSSSLPLRKRPFRGEAETLIPPSLPRYTGHQLLSPAETTDTTHGASECFKARVTDERRVGGAAAAAKHSRLEPPTGPLPDGFPPGHAHRFNSYGKSYDRC
ncbi:hypothetical protein CRUP_004817 [Coryphaenoides rupestris]|nr:hypothetical protein CRUP_004817 [Coryphaenoides rupestris]